MSRRAGRLARSCLRHGAVRPPLSHRTCDRRRFAAPSPEGDSRLLGPRNLGCGRWDADRGRVSTMPWSWAARVGLRQHVRQSLWVVPLLGTAVGALLARMDLWLEGQITLPADWSYSAGTAGTVLATIASAMVGLIG